MREDFAFRVFNKHVKQLIRILNQCPPEQRRVIPEGFNNHVHWHLGHVLVVTQYDALHLSEQPAILPESYHAFFAYGTKPADWQEDPPEWDELIAKLKELRKHIHETLKDRLQEPVKENLLHAENIGELLYLTSLHLHYHQGIVNGMMKSLQVKAGKEEPAWSEPPTDSAIFAGGCFWHMQDAFKKLDGVKRVYAGYTGGQDTNPTYQKVVSRASDHLEAVEVHFNPNEITYEELLRMYWRNIDPTETSGPFHHGSESHSAIFYTSHEQKERAEASRKELETSRRLHKPITTKIAAATAFYKAEDEHQDYYKKVPSSKVIDF